MAASFLGTSMGSDSPDALNATLAPDIVASTPFLLELFDARVRTADGKVDTTLVAYLDEQSAPWWSYILRAPGMAVGGIKSLLGGNKKELPADSLAGGSIELSEEDAKKLHFTGRQASAILEMRLYKLIGLEIEALQKEYETTLLR